MATRSLEAAPPAAPGGHEKCASPPRVVHGSGVAAVHCAVKPLLALAPLSVALLVACGAPASSPEHASSFPSGAPASASSGAPASAPTSTPRSSPAESAAYDGAKEVFEHHCRACHADGTRLSNGNAIRAFDMNSYPFGGEGSPRDVARRVAVSVGLEGGVPTMPKGRSPLSPEDRARIATWVESFQ